MHKGVNTRKWNSVMKLGSLGAMSEAVYQFSCGRRELKLQGSVTELLGVFVKIYSFTDMKAQEHIYFWKSI